MMVNPRDDRRRHVRLPLRQAVKLGGEGAAASYDAGWTHDLSPGGALLEIAGGRPLAPGQRVRVGIAAGPSQALLRRDQMISATVVRRARFGRSERVAVRFDSHGSPADHRAGRRSGLIDSSVASGVSRPIIAAGARAETRRCG